MKTIQEFLKYSFIRYADQVAITCENNNITFSELNGLSNYIADFLLESGYTKGDLIGVLTDRKEISISIILGILKAGCVFVPIDSTLPIERIKDLINCIDLSLIITDTDLETKSSLNFVEIKSFVKTKQYIVILNDKRRLKKDSYRNYIEYEDSDPVYIYFTSGTSGKPKALLGKNKSLLHFIKWEINEFNIDKNYRISQISSIGFDAFLRDIFLPLMVGGTIVTLKSKDTILDSFALINWIERYAINLIHCVPSVFKIISLGNLEKGYFNSLKFILMAGEEIHPESLKKWYSKYGRKIQLINMYGTSETTMAKTIYYINESDIEKTRIPVGKAIPGSQVLVLDKSMKPCPKLVEGEIYIRTPYRTYGYCNMIDNTDDIFIENPFNNDPDDILHKTGDSGKLLMDSNIEYIGRNNEFVKIRGNRVCLGEIENCLLKLDEVKDVVVMTKLDSENNNYLIGYVIPVDKFDSKQYRNYLLNKLPDYMIPNNWVEMESFPLTSNRKINFDAFPEKTFENSMEYKAPRNKQEELIAYTWGELLRIKTDQISIKDDFFLVGGNSLKLVNLISKLHKLTGVLVPIGFIFNNPTIENIADFIKENKQGGYDDIRCVEKKNYYRLSSAQKRIFLLQQMNLDSTAYNMPYVIPLGKEADKEKIEEVFLQLILRHESFRTSFEIEGKEPVQQIHEQVNFKVEEFRIERDEVQNQWHQFIQSFDLSQAPLLRAAIVKIIGADSLLMIDMHHIISDGTSHNILEKEFQTLYLGEELTPLSLQYKDYSEWQNSEEQQKKLKNQGGYWIGQFEGEIPVLNLPTDYPRPAIQNHDGARVIFTFSKEETLHIKSFAKENGLTLYMSVLSVFSILLSKLSGQENVIIGTPIEGRRHIDLENIVGMFVNSLVIRNEVIGSKTLREFIGSLKQTTIEAYENQDYQFEDLVEKVSVNRDTSRNPVFDVMFNLLNQAEYSGDLSAFNNNELNHSQIVSKFDLSLTAIDYDEYILLSFEYCTKLFKSETIERFIRYFNQILIQLHKKLDESLCTVEIITEDEKRQLLFEFNDTQADYPKDKTIQELFEKQALMTPWNIAVSDKVQSITYKELQIKTDKLLKIIRSKGVLSGSVIGIMVDRSIEMIIGVIGILKAGCCYLPIMPNTPKSRFEYFIDDSECALILTQTEYLKNISEGIEFINLKEIETISCPHQELKITNCPNDLAYIIYTSGTTGDPKGVMIENHSVVNRIKWMQKEYPIEPGDVILQKTPYTFDVSVWELFWWSFEGASVYMLESEGEKDPYIILKSIGEKNISVLHFVPSMLESFLSVIKADSKEFYLGIVKYVFSSGEVLKPNQVRNFYSLFAENVKIKLVNLYGPTEATVDVSYFECLRDVDYKNIPIGKPIDNIQLYVLNKKTLSVEPVGIIGELMISGVGLSRGYLKKEELTLEKFIEHPFKEGERLYKTGDLARWLPDGNIEFLGRIDRQLKIRGFRIELGEIEDVIHKHEFIQGSVVLAREENDEKYLCAYVVCKEGYDQETLRNHLSTLLPYYMIPNYFVELDEFPLTSNGKINYKALPVPEIKADDDYEAPRNEIEEKLVDIWSELLNVEEKNISTKANFFEMGGNSLKIINLNLKIKEVYKIDLNIATMFQYPTIKSLARKLSGESSDHDTSDNMISNSENSLGAIVKSGKDIAVIGVAIKSSKANNTEDFWNNLINGIESTTFFSDDELLEAGINKRLLKNPNFVKMNCYVEDKEFFDSEFFGYLPDEAKLMDPQTRMFHELVWTALEDSGYDPYSYEGLIGLYAGSSINIDWLAYTMVSDLSNLLNRITSNNLSNSQFLNALVSYKLNLRGPVKFVNTACSTSMVAIHDAVVALINGECNIALAGGVSLDYNLKSGYLYQEGMINSSDGHCRAFDEEADGTIRGEGAGVVVLKRLDEAISEGDNILAIIKGSAVNNDGKRRVGFTAPSVFGQYECIRMAQKIAQIDPSTISYVEAHGTGTKLGDPIEVEALTQAFGKSEEKYCALGSVKTNIGHLDVAAGVAGFIKTALALKNRQIPPSLHFKNPNPKIDFNSGPFYVNTELKEWKNDKGPLRAGVSSFGLGGTNAHIILEEAPQFKSELAGREHQVIVLSAKSLKALDRITERYKDFLEKNRSANLADMAWTLKTGRAIFDHRRMFVCKDIDNAIEILSTKSSSAIKTITTKKENKNRVFMFAGQGSQYVNMGRELYEKEKIFKKEVDRCFEIIKELSGKNLKEILYPLIENEDNKDNSFEINKTENTQPLLFIFEYALVQLLMHWGVTPDRMIGHSIGEYVAACISGVFTLEDGLKIVMARGRLMQSLQCGSMLSVAISEDKLKPLLLERLSLAAINAPEMCVISGNNKDILLFKDLLEKKGYNSSILHTSHAFHSYMMQPILDEFKEELRGITLNKPRIPFISNLTGDFITEAESNSLDYWGKHLRETVQFSKGIQTLLKIENSLFIEIGPGKVLNTFVQQQDKNNLKQKGVSIIKSHREKGSDQKYLLNGIGELWLHGVYPDWKKFYEGENRRRISLPTYSFEKIKFPIGGNVYKMISEVVSTQLPKKKNDISEWFFEPSWKGLRLTEEGIKKNEELCVLIFTTQLVGQELISKFKEEFSKVVIVLIGDDFKKLSEKQFVINPNSYNNYEKLFKSLKESEYIPDRIIHMWNVEPVEELEVSLSIEKVKEVQNIGFYSLLNITRAINEIDISSRIKMSVLTNSFQSVLGSEVIHPEKSTILGALLVITQENPNIFCNSIDILSNELWRNIRHINSLYKEIKSNNREKIIAYRNGKRWVKTYTPSKIYSENISETKLKKGGVYLITGGLGGVGFAYTKYLLNEYNANVILVGRTDLAENGAIDKKNRLKELNLCNGNVQYFKADTSDYNEMEKVIEKGEDKFGKINGIIHAAGITRGSSTGGSSFNLVNFLTQKDCENQFAPKIYGLITLEKIFRSKDLDFCLLVSSMSSIIGGHTFSAYAAANSFMDYFASSNKISNCISINYDGLDFSDNHNWEDAINKDEGIDILNCVLAVDKVPQLVVSMSDLDARIEKWVNINSDEAIEAIDKINKDRESIDSKPSVYTKASIKPLEVIQEKLCIIWQNFFGITEIGIDDDFFELGGDSLRATTIVSRIYKEFNVKINIVDFFNSGTIRELASIIEKSNFQKYESIVSSEKKEYYDLSPEQKRLFILHELDKSSLAYNVFQMEYIERIEKDFLEKVIRKIIARHESLRTSIELIKGIPYQKIYDEVFFEVEYYEISSKGIESIKLDFIRPFKLSTPPLFRVALIRTEDNVDILLIDKHHIITDGVSHYLFIEEFLHLANGKELNGLQLHYKDYSEWLNSKEQQERIKIQEEYWLKEFSGNIPVLKLPYDYPRPQMQSFEGATVSFSLNSNEYDIIKKICQEQEITVYMCLLSLTYILFSKLSGQDDIIIGSSIAARSHPDLEKIIGMFVNTLAMRNYPKGDKSFTEFLAEVKQKTLLAHDNQEYAFEDLVNKLIVNRDMSRNPLFDIHFDVHSINEVINNTNNSSNLIYNKSTSKFDITIAVFEYLNCIKIIIEYNTNIFMIGKIELIIKCFKNIISEISLNNKIKISDIELLKDDEQKRLIKEIKKDYQSIHEGFEEYYDNTDEIDAPLNI